MSDLPPMTGYRCMECGTVSEDGSAHADECGQPQRDLDRSKDAWYEQLEDFIPTGPAPTTGETDAMMRALFTPASAEAMANRVHPLYRLIDKDKTP